MDYKLLILDVDGTLTTTKSGETFRKTANDWQWLPGRIEKCEELRAQGVQIAIASNQAGVAFPWSKFSEQEMQTEIDKVGSEIGACFVAVCYTTPNIKALPAYHNPSDTRRKPGPGMLLEAMQHCKVSPSETLMVGDRSEDEEAAKSAGCNFILADDFFKQPAPQTSPPKAKRYRCLSCGKAHNHYQECPRCGADGNDQIYNVENPSA